MLADILSRNRNVISLGFCLSFSMLCLLWQTNPFAQGLAFFGKVADRISTALNSGLSFTGDFIADIDEYRDLKQKYAQLQTQLEQYELEHDKFDQLKRQNEIYRISLEFKENSVFKEQKAEVLGVRLNAISPRIIIGRGKKDGLLPMMPVVSRAHDKQNNLIRSVVGIIVSVDTNSSIVQPLYHPSFRLGVRIEQTKEWAMLSGNSDRHGTVFLTYITSDFEEDQATFANRSDELRKEYSVYTSGAGGIFPKGIPVGYITSKSKRQNEFKTAYVTPYASIASLDFVSVIMKRPAAWTHENKNSRSWEETLETEFGAPEYPEVRETRTKTQKPITTQQQSSNTKDTDSQTDANNQSTSIDQPDPQNIQPRRRVNVEKSGVDN